MKIFLYVSKRVGDICRFSHRMMPGAVPLRGPPGQGPRAGTAMRGPMGRGDYGKYYKNNALPLFVFSEQKSCLLVK